MSARACVPDAKARTTRGSCLRRPPKVACWRCVSQSRAHTSRFVRVTHAPSHVHLCVSDAVWWHYRFQNARGVCLPSDATTARGPGRASGRRWHPPSAFDAFGRPHKARAHCHVHSASAHPDLNRGPADLRSAALTTELCTRMFEQGNLCKTWFSSPSDMHLPEVGLEPTISSLGGRRLIH